MANLLLSKIFLKPVDRPIEGVIKADGETGLKTEVEEYVLTAEVERRLESFLEIYVDYANANGGVVLPPAGSAGFIRVRLNGTFVRIAVYAD